MMKQKTMAMDFMEELGLPEGYANAIWERVQASPYARELKLNVKSVLEGEHLEAKERALISLAVAGNERNSQLVNAFARIALQAGAQEVEVAEALACASLLSANNVLYRFRHFVGKDTYSQMPARLRMNLMLKPASGKEIFELLSLAVSAVNGCEVCVKAHEQSLMGLGCSEQRVWEAIRIAAVVRSLGRVI